MREPEAGADPPLLLTMSIAGHHVAIPALSVREVVSFRPPSALPAMPRWLLGLLNRRGTAVPLVDLAMRLGLAAPARGESSSVVVVETSFDGEPCVVGFVVDDVADVVQLDPPRETSAADVGLPVSARFLAGLSSDGTAPVYLLDATKVLAFDGPDHLGLDVKGTAE